MKKLFAMMMALLMAVSLMCSASALSLNDVQKKVDGILYADVIKNLPKGSGYAFVPVADKGFDALIVADNVKANKAGFATAKKATVYCVCSKGNVKNYGKIVSDTNLAVSQKKYLITTCGTEIVKDTVGIYTGSMMTYEAASRFTEKGKTIYYYSNYAEKYTDKVSTDGTHYKELQKELNNAEVINFNIVK